MIESRWRVVVAGAVVMLAAVVVVPVGGREPSAGTAHVAGSLRLSAEVASAHSVIRARGRVVPATKRRVVLQRSVGGRWWSVGSGTSTRRGHYALVTRVPRAQSHVVRYRVLLPRWRVGGRVLPARVTPTDSVRTTSAASATPTTAPTPLTTTVPGPTVTPSPPPPSSGTPPPAPPGTTVVAEWPMDEPAGSTRMTDVSGRAHHGAISPHAAAAGLVLTGAAYEWSQRCRDCPPVALPRVVQVTDSADLEIPDPAVRWSLELRFSTTKSHGNLAQKGQSATPGGQIKVEDPGALRCVFTGAGGRSAVAVGPTPLDDGRWHTVACVHTSTSVSQWVDGALVAQASVATGPIDNQEPFVIGGKTTCNQRSVGCDYFSGAIAWARISHG